MLPTLLTYAPVFVAAVLEGELVYVTACIAASRGWLNPFGVVLAGALGGSAGDQFWFYLLRGRLAWLDRFPKLARRHRLVSARVHSHETGMLLVSRFLPGLRIAIPAACAYAGVRPARFSTLNLASAFAWAGALMIVVANLGPRAAAALGLSGLWAVIVPAGLAVAFLRWLGSPPRSSQ